MLLDLAKLLREPGETLPFSAEFDFSDMSFGGNQPAREPLRAEGEIRNTAGVLLLEGRLEGRLNAVCDRCARAFEKKLDIPLHVILEADPDSAESDDLWTFPVTDGHADLEDIVRTAFVLNMESKLLCREDCKGLCCRCGADLNLGACGCKPEPDARFAVLQKLLQKDP